MWQSHAGLEVTEKFWVGGGWVPSEYVYPHPELHRVALSWVEFDNKQAGVWIGKKSSTFSAIQTFFLNL